MGNAPNAPTDVAAHTLASGLPQELDWHLLITQLFRPSHNAVLLLTSEKETEAVPRQPCKVVESIRVGSEGPIVAPFDPALLDSRVGVVSQKGKKSLPNQDNAFYLQFRDGDDGADVWMACVMDGHGSLGHDMSRLVMQWLPLLVVREPSMKTEAGRMIPSDPQAVFNGIANAFEKLGALMVRASTASSQREVSGTTCVFTLYSRGLLHSANVGDSRAILGIQDTGTEPSFLKLKLQVRELTRDHKPNIEEEKLRVEAHGGEVRGNRVWIKEPPWVGLNLSRSLGDSIVHRVGVSHEADVATTFLDETLGQVLIIASDGVWEFLSSADVAESVAANLAFTSVQDATGRLLRHAMDRWHERSSERDDITIIIVVIGSLGGRLR